LNEHLRIWSIKNAARAHAGLPPLAIPPFEPLVAAVDVAVATTTTIEDTEVTGATSGPPTTTVTLEEEEKSSIRMNTSMDSTTTSSPSCKKTPKTTHPNGSGNSQLFVLDTTPQTVTEPTKNDIQAASVSVSISAPPPGGTRKAPRVMEWTTGTTSPAAVEKGAIPGSKAPPLAVTAHAAYVEAWTNNTDTDTGGGNEDEDDETMWKEMYMDAQEFELASFTLQRPTAVKRLQELAFRLKQASQLLRQKKTKEMDAKRSLDEMEPEGGLGKVPRKPCKKSKPTTTTTQTRSPPLLKPTDAWVCHHSVWSGNLCPSFEKDNHCPLGAQCPRTHVYRLGPDETQRHQQQRQPQKEGNEIKWTKEDVMQMYERYRQRSLVRQDFAEKIKDHWFSARFTCPIDNIYYYAHGQGGMASSQRLEWYATQKEAHDAVATLVLHALQLRQMIPADVSSRTPPLLVSNRSSNASRATTKSTPPPLVTPWNWMEPHVDKRCGHFLDPKKTCRFGKFCRFSHVHFPTQLTTTTTTTTPITATIAGSIISDNGAPSDQLIEIYKQQFDVLDPAPLLQDCHFTKSVGEHWCTAGFKCPVESTIYYAAGGCHSYINSQNIYLYPSPEDALSAVDCVVLNAFIKRGLTTTTSKQNNPEPSSTQIKNNSNNKTQQSKEEEDSDIADMFGSDDEDEDNQEKDTLNQKHIKHPNSAESDADVDTHEMFDSDDNTDEQEMFDTNGNTDAKGLPVLKHKDWMVPASKKHCKDFASPRGCRVTSNHCKYIHVYPTRRKKEDGLPSSDDSMPHDDALAFAYRTNFPNNALLSARDFCHLCITCEGKQWHTSALTCPREQVIYYAAGGKNAVQSSQRIYWYPTQEDAKLAVAAVVLRAFSIRGMYGSGRNPFESE